MICKTPPANGRGCLSFNRTRHCEERSDAPQGGFSCPFGAIHLLAIPSIFWLSNWCFLLSTGLHHRHSLRSPRGFAPRNDVLIFTQSTDLPKWIPLCLSAKLCNRLCQRHCSRFGLLQGVPGGADLDEEGPGAEVLVVAVFRQAQIPADARVGLFQ